MYHLLVEVILQKTMRRLNKKGLTLIELIITLSIFMIFITTSVSVYFSLYKRTKNALSANMCENYILHIINDSKRYCKERGRSGYIYFDENKNISFYCFGRKIKSYTLPKGFKLEYVNTKNELQRVDIDNFGNTSDACTISFKNKKGKKYEMTIRVGTNYVQIK